MNAKHHPTQTTRKSRVRRLADRVHSAGYPFIAAAAAVTVGVALLAPVFGVMAAIVTGWLVYFFRDPVRVVPQDDALIISPADGRIQAVTQDAPPAEIDDDAAATAHTRISIFLDIFDVHVNRLPVSGVVRRRVYKRGHYLNAASDKASEKNERCSLLIERGDGANVYLVQIAGLIARRIVCHPEEGETVVAGRRFGIIRFGSRVDVYVPPGFTPQVAVGQRAIGGETVLAAAPEAGRQAPATRAE